MTRTSVGLRACVLVALLLVACSTDVGSIPGVFTTGEIRILGLEPDIRECIVREGIWLALLGESFGAADAWVSGEHRVIFPPNPPGIDSESVQLAGNALFVLVPAGVASGTLVIDAGAHGTAEIAITVEAGGPASMRAQMVGTICVTNPPPP